MSNLNQIEPPVELKRQILSRIAVLSWRQAKIRLLAWGSLAATSLVGFISVLVYAWQGFVDSSLFQYLRLIWSDQASLVPYWREFAWSILESLPAFFLASALAGLGIFTWSMLKFLESNHYYYGFKKFA